jgi:hypothetical protein
VNTSVKVLLAAIAAGAISLAGCVKSEQTYTADGQLGHVINCTPAWTGGIVGQVASASTSWGTCYQKAGELCGAAGYDIIQQVGEGGVYGQGGGSGGFVSSTNNRTMIVKCKGQAQAQASAR